MYCFVVKLGSFKELLTTHNINKAQVNWELNELFCEKEEQT